MAGFDPVVIVVGVLAAALVVLLIRMFMSTPVQSAGPPLRTAALGGSSPPIGQNGACFRNRGCGGGTDQPGGSQRGKGQGYRSRFDCAWKSQAT
jgi:hypothetical protein